LAVNGVWQVKNILFGNVQFTAEKVDSDSGFQQGSLVKLYSNITEPGVYNLLHIHVEDTSDSVLV
jgi:hypothetical protein